jgi:uncharacterized protein YodC (DUF2158 family)
MAFKPGDVVRLKSGGPEMTVTEVVGDNPETLEKFKADGFTEGDVVVEHFAIHKLLRNVFKKTSVRIVEDNF